MLQLEHKFEWFLVILIYLQCKIVCTEKKFSCDNNVNPASLWYLLNLIFCQIK